MPVSEDKLRINDNQDDRNRGSSRGFWEFLEAGPRTSTILTAFSVIVLLWILKSVLIPFLIACILAALTWPMRNRVLKWTKGRSSLTSGLLILGLISLIAAPISGISFLAILQAKELKTDFDQQSVMKWVQNTQSLLEQSQLAHDLGLTSEKVTPKLEEALSNIAGWGLDSALGLGSTFLHALVLTGIALMSLFYLYQSGDKFIDRIQKHLPLPPEQVSHLLQAFRNTSRAIFKGNFVIGGLQGLLTGILFWATGLPSPAFFGVLTAFCSLIPAVGTGLVWGPAGILLLVSGNVTSGLVVLGIGGVIIASIDSVLRPVLVGRDAGMHDLMVFLTTLGGLSFFGPVGVLFGPLVGAGVMALLRLQEAPSAEP